MLLKPCVGPSTKYIMVPNRTETTKTKKTNTKILVLLAFNDLTKLLDSTTNLTNLSIRNTLNNRRALKAVRYCDCIKKKVRYLGIVESRSTMPKKLKIYFLGFFIQTSLRMYSIEKRMVTTHSEILKNLWY